MDRKRKRVCVINEIISSELSYIEAMQKMLDFIYNPLVLADVLQEEEIEVLFCGIRDVVEVNKRFYNEVSEVAYDDKELAVLTALQKYCTEVRT